MSNQHTADRLRRDIQNVENLLARPKWKVLLVIFAISLITIGGTQVLMLYKEDVDLTSTSFLANLLGLIFIASYVISLLVRFIARWQLKKMKRKLEDIQ